MQPAWPVNSKPGVIVRLRPAGPWRFGTETGARDQVDLVCHSDTLYSAVSWAMGRLGMLGEWLAETAVGEGEPAVRFSSMFPSYEGLLYVTPPRHLWPPLAFGKVRWKGARLVPAEVVSGLVNGQAPDEERWAVDGESQCLAPARKDGSAPRLLRIVMRAAAAVDRISQGAVEAHHTACVEYGEGAGMWCAAVFEGEEARQRWRGRLEAAFRLLADSGLGGERSRGWGRSEMPQFTEGSWPDLLIPPPPAPAEEEAAAETSYWLLSLYAPSQADTVDWKRGDYALVTRGGWAEANGRSGQAKRLTRMVAEGSVVLAGGPPSGSVRDVAPEGYPHPVYRAGYALAAPIPWRVAQ